MTSLQEEYSKLGRDVFVEGREGGEYYSHSYVNWLEFQLEAFKEKLKTEISYGRLADEQLAKGKILTRVISKVTGRYCMDCVTTIGKIYYSWEDDGYHYSIESDNGYPIGVPRNDLIIKERIS